MGGIKYGYDKEGKPFLTKEPTLLLNDDNAGKPEGIHLTIGRKPFCSPAQSRGQPLKQRDERSLMRSNHVYSSSIAPSRDQKVIHTSARSVPKKGVSKALLKFVRVFDDTSSIRACRRHA